MVKREQLRDDESEKRLFQNRLSFLLAFFSLIGLALLGRYFSLQVINYQKFVTESNNNRIYTLPLAPRRGLIYDRNGVLLAENQPSYSLLITKERVNNLDELLIDLQQLFDIDDKNVEKFRRRLRNRTPYQGVPLKFKLTDDEISRFAVNRYRLTGVEVEAQLVRQYPLGEAFAHVIGYVGRINSKEQQKILERSETKVNYAATHHIGKTGLEKYYEMQLHGKVGSRYVETNAHGRVLNILQQENSIPGSDLQLYLDAELQQYIYDLLKDKRAAVVVLDVHTGGVLAMVSTPSYDTNLFINGISNDKFSELRESHDLPLFNRALQGQYPPGSTLKPIFGLAGLYYGVIDKNTKVRDPGWYQLPNDERYYRDWKRSGHGEYVDLKQAIEESCDVFFYDLAYQLGIDRLHEFSTAFGLGIKTGIDSVGERDGLMPSRQWKRKNKNSAWYPGETLNVGIGQGYMLSTPLQLAVSTSIIANKGLYIKPGLVKTESRHVDGWFSEALLDEDSDSYATMDSRINISDSSVVSDDYWNFIYDSMKSVIHGNKGTAKNISEDISYYIAGKTGTAQVIGIPQDAEYDEEEIAERQRDHALFVGFAPIENPEIALSVIIENGGSGSSTAAPIARSIFDWFLDNEMKKKKKKKKGKVFANFGLEKK